jgi:hypothetical protein
MVRENMNRITATSVETCFTALIFFVLLIGAAMSFNAFFYPTSSLVLTKLDNYENINAQEPIKYGDKLISHPLVMVIPGKYIELKNQNDINDMIYIELQVQDGIINQINMNGKLLKLDSINSRGVLYKNDQTTCIVNQILNNAVLINIKTAQKKASGVIIFSNDNCIFHINGKRYPVLDAKYNQDKRFVAYGEYNNTRMLFWKMGEVAGICKYNADQQNKYIYMSTKSPECYLNDDNTKIMIRPYFAPYGFDVNADASQIERVQNRKATLTNMGYDAGVYIAKQWNQIYQYHKYLMSINPKVSATTSDPSVSDSTAPAICSAPTTCPTAPSTLSDQSSPYPTTANPSTYGSDTLDPVNSYPTSAGPATINISQTNISQESRKQPNQDVLKPDIHNQELQVTKQKNNLDQGPANSQNRPNEKSAKNARGQINQINKLKEDPIKAIVSAPQSKLTVRPSQQKPRTQLPKTTTISSQERKQGNHLSTMIKRRPTFTQNQNMQRRGTIN